MNLGLESKTAIIAASTTGLGFAAAKELANEGASVAICGRNQSDLHKAEEEITSLERGEVFAALVDIRDKSAVAQWV